ncbi:MAG: hypothetical protein WBH86_08105 [Thermogutta sp.]
MQSFKLLRPLEARVMEMMLAGDHPVLNVLRDQLDASHVLERTYTGVGFFTKFYVPPEMPRIKAGRVVIDDVRGEIRDYYGPGRSWVCHFLLFVEGGVIDTLEGATPDDEWTNDESLIGLSYCTEAPATGSKQNRRDWRRLFRLLEES